MEPAVHHITILAPQPPALWSRLETVLAEGGSPPIAMTRSASTVTFTSSDARHRIWPRMPILSSSLMLLRLAVLKRVPRRLVVEAARRLAEY